jgi:hypothetical protein
MQPVLLRSPVVKSDELVPIAPDLFNNLFNLPGSHENEYIMKAVM